MGIPVLRFRDNDGNIVSVPAIKGEKGDTGAKGEQGEKGDSYILTEADKTEIANIVLANFTDVSGVGM